MEASLFSNKCCKLVGWLLLWSGEKSAGGSGGCTSCGALLHEATWPSWICGDTSCPLEGGGGCRRPPDLAKIFRVRHGAPQSTERCSSGFSRLNNIHIFSLTRRKSEDKGRCPLRTVYSTSSWVDPVYADSPSMWRISSFYYFQLKKNMKKKNMRNFHISI